MKLKEFWEFRELLYFLAWRDVKVRYKQTALGAVWAILQPLLTMVVFTIFFQRVAEIPTDGTPPPIFYLSGLIPWTFFANSMGHASSSLVGSANLVKKVYFPRLIVPTAAALVSVVDIALSFIVLLGMMAFYGMMLGPAAVGLLPLLLLALVTSMGVGFWLSALNAQYRDIRYTLPFLTQIWLFATPVIYPSTLIDEPWRTLFALNPMVGVVEGFRWALLGSPAPSPYMLAISSVVALLIFISGAFYFRRMERTFADIV